jgi:hypothetical protein
MATRRTALPAGGELAYLPDDWRDSLVVVEQGSIELESRHGVRRTFVAGDALWLRGLRLRVLRNRGSSETVLAATSRRNA